MGPGAVSESECLHTVTTTIGIVVALPDESRTLTRHIRQAEKPVQLGDSAWVALSTGVGPEAAMSTGQRLLSAGVDALVSWGTAGALDPSLAAGDLLLPNRVIDGEAQEYWPDAGWLERLSEVLNDQFTVRKGTLLQSTYLVATANQKLQLRESVQAEAVDMESAAIAHLAHERNVPFLAVRAITDTASTDIPQIVTHAIDSDGRVRLMRLLRNACLRPQDLPALIGLARKFSNARATLVGLSCYAASGLCIMNGRSDRITASVSIPCNGPPMP